MSKLEIRFLNFQVQLHLLGLINGLDPLAARRKVRPSGIQEELEAKEASRRRQDVASKELSLLGRKLDNLTFEKVEGKNEMGGCGGRRAPL